MPWNPLARRRRRARHDGPQGWVGVSVAASGAPLGTRRAFNDAPLDAASLDKEPGLVDSLFDFRVDRPKKKKTE